MLANLQLPRFVLRHPQTASAVLLSMLQLTINFSEQSQPAPHQQIDETLPEEPNDRLDADDTSPADPGQALSLPCLARLSPSPPRAPQAHDVHARTHGI